MKSKSQSNQKGLVPSKTKSQSGFTIIEVLIVLAIAGLILLIVFLAVPALQRNSRNTQSKSEAASLLGATSEFINNNNGKMPVAGDNATILGNAKLQNITTLTIEVAANTTPPDSTTAVLRTGAKCTSPTGSSATLAGSSRQLALLYQIENSAGNLVACVES